jgi:hypothetical protein
MGGQGVMMAVGTMGCSEMKGGVKPVEAFIMNLSNQDNDACTPMRKHLLIWNISWRQQIVSEF